MRCERVGMCKKGTTVSTLIIGKNECFTTENIKLILSLFVNADHFVSLTWPDHSKEVTFNLI